MVRATDWEQPADRHTKLVDPVITVRQLARFDFTRKPPTRIDHALVFSTPRGSYDCYLPPMRPSRSEIAAKRYTAVYEVDMGVHPVQAGLTLPSENDAFEFEAVVDLSWQVVQPDRFVASGHRDVPRLLVGELEQAARPVARRFPIADSAHAEQDILAAVSARGSLGATAGLKVLWTVRLRRDQENVNHQRRMQAINHQADEQILTQHRGMELDDELDRRSRHQDALQMGRALAYGRQEQELVLQQQRWQHERAVLDSRQAVELQQLQTEKIAFYQWHLRQGGVHAWALRLAEHPEDSLLAINSMREDQLRLIQAQMDLVRQLLGGDGAESYELEGPKQLALRALSEILSQRLPGIAAPGPAESAQSFEEQQPEEKDQLSRGFHPHDVPAEPPAPTPLVDTPAAAAFLVDTPPAPPPATSQARSAFPDWQPPPGYDSAPVAQAPPFPTDAPPPESPGSGPESEADSR
ncbi:hypothetical protein ACFYNY_26960 [Streptomyces sp. NPDC006530]|uniref:hypothetical protein n=1 Tax=Streptomyces sp. NPDC006530 TaxID=3364750 RepID=UPI0036809D19